MKKVKSFFTNITIAVLSMLAIILLSEFVQKIDNETVDTNYMLNMVYSNLNVSEGSKQGDITLENNTLDLNVTLEKELEFYEFTIDVTNKGSLDAKISKLTNDITSDKNILQSKISYADDREIKIGDIIKSNETKTLKVRIDYPKQESKIYDALTLNMNLYIEYKAIQ